MFNVSVCLPSEFFTCVASIEIKFAAASTVSPSEAEPLDSVGLAVRRVSASDRTEAGPDLAAKLTPPPPLNLRPKQGEVAAFVSPGTVGQQMVGQPEAMTNWISPQRALLERNSFH